MERKPLNFTSTNDEIYNKIYSTIKLLEPLKKGRDTAVGSDDIHYQILKENA
jgi:bacillopeptidase F (M6 metalloprotease family)